MSKFTIDAYILIPCERFDIHLHLRGEIHVDFIPGNEADNPSDLGDELGEGNDPECPDDDHGAPNYPPINYN